MRLFKSGDSNLRNDWIVEIRGLSFKYRNGPVALNNINLCIEKGSLVGIIGPNGAGKTSLCRSLNGLIPHFYGGEFKGEVIVCGLNTLKHSVAELSTKVGYVFQDPEDQLSGMATRVDEEVAFGLSMLGFPLEEMRQRVESVLERVGLKGFESRNPLDLSGGEQQRLAIATVLAIDPEVIVMDEPTAQLDPLGKSQVLEVIGKLKHEGKTIIITSHEIEELVYFADRLVVLHDGKIVLEGSTEEVLREVDLLKSIGVDPPSVTELAHLLKMRNIFSCEKYPVTIHEAIKLFTELIQRLRVIKNE